MISDKLLEFIQNQLDENKKEVNNHNKWNSLTEARKHYYDGLIDSLEIVRDFYKQEIL